MDKQVLAILESQDPGAPARLVLMVRERYLQDAFNVHYYTALCLCKTRAMVAAVVELTQPVDWSTAASVSKRVQSEESHPLKDFWAEAERELTLQRPAEKKRRSREEFERRDE